MIARRLLAAGLALACGAAGAQALESVLSPGPVIEGHAKYGDECRNCHIPFNRAAQNGLCLDCHRDTAADVKQEKGYHGRLKPQPCRACHTDHKGRGAKISSIDEQAFDHEQTDFALRGAHAEPPTTCRSCHLPAKKFREAPSRCVDCHANQDVHKGRLGIACANCHSESNWKVPLFDHSKTRLPLRGKHVALKCASCHKNDQYKDTPVTCIGCHRKDDKHQGTLGVSCGDCHSESDWKVARFDHAKTRFPLLGKHNAIKCAACHKSAVYKDAPRTCIGCHRKDDKHKGALGEPCGDCHTERNWKESKFDHAKTRFPLLQSHARVKCESCHRDPDYARRP